MHDKPLIRPNRPFFSSGPTVKRPDWQLHHLRTDSLGRSHRSGIGKKRLAEVISKSRSILGLPDDYLLGLVPASDTGAIEMALWSMLGERETDIYYWDAFGKDWSFDITKELCIPANIYSAPYGLLPDLSKASRDHDIVFTWNGTTSGVCVPNGDWIATDRKGLTICDATSAVFAMPLPWEKLDVVTWSWQKALGGEGGHGMIALSPRAVERLEQFAPDRPLPKIFRLTKDQVLLSGIFSGETINTPSMLAVEDQIDALDWALSIGGLPGLLQRAKKNFSCLEQWVKTRSWISFLAKDPSCRSRTSVCFEIAAPLGAKIAKLLEEEQAAFDINAYRDAPPGLRIWCGPTVELEDLERLLPWLDWAYQTVGRSN